MITPADSAPQRPGQMPAAPNSGPAPVPFGGDQTAGNAPLPPAGLTHGTPGVEVMNGVATGNYVHANPLAAPNVNPYDAGPLSPIGSPVDRDSDVQDDVSGTVGGAVAASDARWGLAQQDTYQQGSVIGDLMALPPVGLDPGVGSLGITDPAGSYYDPPRSY